MGMQLAVTGMGLISSVGHDVVTACAAIRAGVQRPRELLHFTVLDAAEQESVPLVARPVAGYTEGYTGVGLWLRLAVAALDDMRQAYRLPEASNRAFWDSTAIYAVTPALAEGRFDDEEHIHAAALQSRYVATLTEQMGWPVPPHLHKVISIGHAGAIEAVGSAANVLSGSGAAVERVILVCSDSLLDPLSLEWLDALARLKSDDNPFGLIPGEAGACIMLEAPVAAHQRGARTVALLEAWSLVPGAQHPLAGEPMLGQSLAQAFDASLASAQVERFAGMVVCDLNGEPWRSQDWGTARVRIGPRFGDEMRWIFPADSLGDVGSASGAVAICVAAEALKRGCAHTDAVLISATSDDGTVGTLFVRAASTH